uniref:Uncharacterized protein n=1 Tax=Tanacetum cinerariifolium TaxID=118510 RepID=A0A699IEY5_TANCI|nr:hypothetical protein [Tanacetum cinerariifolium]
MDEPLSPDRVFDFPMDEPEPHPAYDFFTPGPLPGYVGNPNNGNGWIKADVPLLGELGAMANEPMVGLLVDEIAEPIVEAEDQVIAPVIDMEDDIAMLFVDGNFSDGDSEGFKDEKEVGGPSTVTAEGQSFTLPAPIFPVPLTVIEDLSTDMGNLKYGHGHLFKKVIQAMDRLEQVGAQVEQGQQTAIQRDETMVFEMSSHERTLIQCIIGMDRRLADLERRPPGPQ